ncbi:MAG: 2OG-Fe dioxygenase family protein, partial [Nostoc sp.]
ELLLINDHEFLHFANPIKPLTDAKGSWDVFVLTSPSLLSE